MSGIHVVSIIWEIGLACLVLQSIALPAVSERWGKRLLAAAFLLSALGSSLGFVLFLSLVVPELASAPPFFLAVFVGASLIALAGALYAAVATMLWEKGIWSGRTVAIACFVNAALLMASSGRTLFGTAQLASGIAVLLAGWTIWQIAAAEARALPGPPPLEGPAS